MERSQQRKTAWEARRSAAERYRCDPTDENLECFLAADQDWDMALRGQNFPYCLGAENARSYLTIDRDARRLLRKRASPSRRGPGKPRKGQSPSILFSKADKLLKKCVADSVPTPDSLAALISSFLPTEEPSLTAKQRKAVEREIQPGREAWQFNAKPGVWPTNVPVQHVAKHARVTRRTVYNWRVDPKYRLACEGRLMEPVVKAVKEAFDRTFRKDAIREKSPISQKEQLRQLMIYAHHRWRGPPTSPIDGKVYDTWEEYARHLLEHGRKFAKRKPWDVKRKPE